MSGRSATLALIALLTLPTTAGARRPDPGAAAYASRQAQSGHARASHRVQASARAQASRHASASSHAHHHAHVADAHRLTRVNEYGALELYASEGATVQEHGKGWGTFSCSVRLGMTLRGTLVRASYTAHLETGSIFGAARAHIHKASGQYASFSGTIWLHGGSGKYAKASGHAGFYGTINRHSYAMRIHISGRVQL